MSLPVTDPADGFGGGFHGRSPSNPEVHDRAELDADVAQVAAELVAHAAPGAAEVRAELDAEVAVAAELAAHAAHDAADVPADHAELDAEVAVAAELTTHTAHDAADIHTDHAGDLADVDEPHAVVLVHRAHDAVPWAAYPAAREGVGLEVDAERGRGRSDATGGEHEFDHRTAQRARERVVPVLEPASAPRLVSRRQVAARLRVSVRTTQRLESEGLLRRASTDERGVLYEFGHVEEVAASLGVDRAEPAQDRAEPACDNAEPPRDRAEPVLERDHLAAMIFKAIRGGAGPRDLVADLGVTPDQARLYFEHWVTLGAEAPVPRALYDTMTRLFGRIPEGRVLEQLVGLVRQLASSTCPDCRGALLPRARAVEADIESS